jgi:opacity protein-like surface antigen
MIHRDIAGGSKFGWVIILLALAFFSGVAAADDPIDFYVGAGVGEGNIKVDQNFATTPVNFSKSDLGWKLMAGVRPLPVLGAEVEYIDFGHPSTMNSDASAKGFALFGVGYLPLPLPFMDIYGKAGYARLQSKANGSFGAVVIDCFPDICHPSISRTDKRFAWGLGVQAKVLAATARLEYERIDAVNGDPSLLSLAMTWHF